MKWILRDRVSSAFSYEHCMCKRWLDRWLMRGGSLHRDSVTVNRAQDMQDLRTWNERETWSLLQRELRFKRVQLRQSELLGEIHAAKAKPKLRSVK